MNTRYIYSVVAVLDKKSDDIEFFDSRYDAEKVCNHYNTLKDNGEPYLQTIKCFLIDRRRINEHTRPAGRRFKGIRKFFTDALYHRILSGETPSSDYTEDDLPF